MPAAAVIPAPIAYINVVAVKKLVVEDERVVNSTLFRKILPVTLKKLECSTQVSPEYISME